MNINLFDLVIMKQRLSHERSKMLTVVYRIGNWYRLTFIIGISAKFHIGTPLLQLIVATTVPHLLVGA